MPYANDNVLPVTIDRLTEALSAVIAAPGAGKRLAIDFIQIAATGGANTVTLSGNTTSIFPLAANGVLQIDNSIHNPTGIFLCDDNQAFSLAQGSANRLTGYVLYRILNG